jgi:hypothetical protein
MIGTAATVVLSEKYARDNLVSTKQSAAALSFSTGKKHF